MFKVSSLTISATGNRDVTSVGFPVGSMMTVWRPPNGAQFRASVGASNKTTSRASATNGNLNTANFARNSATSNNGYVIGTGNANSVVTRFTTTLANGYRLNTGTRVSNQAFSMMCFHEDLDVAINVIEISGAGTYDINTGFQPEGGYIAWQPSSSSTTVTFSQGMWDKTLTQNVNCSQQTVSDGNNYSSDSHAMAAVSQTGGISVAGQVTAVLPNGFRIVTTGGGTQTFFAVTFGPNMKVKCGRFHVSSSGSMDVTGVGFQPQALLTGAVRTTNGNGAFVSMFSLGMTDTNLDAAVGTSGQFKSGSSTSHGVALRRDSTAEDYNVRASVSSWLPDGFSLNVDTYNGARSFMYLALAYDQPATVELNTANETEFTTETPTLEFTGTDPNNDRVEYEIEIEDTILDEYYFDGHQGISDPDNAWNDDANAFIDDSSFAQATADGNETFTTNYLRGIGTNAPTSGRDILEVTLARNGSITTQVQARHGSDILGSSADFPTPISAPNGGWTWQKLRDLEVRFRRTIDFLGGNIEFGWIQVIHGTQIAAASATDPGFLNEDDNGDTSPFKSGDKISYTLQDNLPNGTYTWRVRARDPGGSNEWSDWTATREFIVNSGEILELDNASHDHDAENIIPARLTSVDINDALHTHAAEEFALLSRHLLSIANSSHSITSEEIDLLTNILLSVSGTLHAHSSSNINTSVINSLSISDSLHGLVSDNVSLSGLYDLIVSGASHAHAADGLSELPSFIAIYPDSASHALASDEANIAKISTLDISNSKHLLKSVLSRMINWGQLGVYFGVYKPDYKSSGNITPDELTGGVIIPKHISHGDYQKLLGVILLAEDLFVLLGEDGFILESESDNKYKEDLFKIVYPSKGEL